MLIVTMSASPGRLRRRYEPNHSMNMRFTNRMVSSLEIVFAFSPSGDNRAAAGFRGGPHGGRRSLGTVLDQRGSD